jgi:hypothetical protein
MIADHAITLVTSVLTGPSFGSSLDCSGSLRIDRGEPLEPLVRVFRHLRPSTSAPPEFLAFATLPSSEKRQDSTSPREVPHGLLSSSFPACSLRMSGMLRQATPSPGFSQLYFLSSFALTPRITMAHQSKSGTVQLALDISPDARLRFESLHQSMGLKTKAQTFEAILYFVSTKDKIDPAALQRMEKKIDHSIHLLESLT